MQPFTPLERAIIDKLLAEGPNILEPLRQQAAAASVSRRDLTGVGFFTEIVLPPHFSRAQIQPRAHLSDVDAQMPNLSNGAGFVLFIKDGALERLEGYTYDEPWPERADEFTLHYRKLPRDFSALLLHQKDV